MCKDISKFNVRCTIGTNHLFVTQSHAYVRRLKFTC